MTDKFERQHPIAVYYDDIIVGEFAADIVVEEVIIVELKSVKRIVKVNLYHIYIQSYDCIGIVMQLY